MVSVYNPNGVKVFQKPLIKGLNSFNVDIINSGIYNLAVKTDNTIFNQKIRKQKNICRL